MSVAAKTFGTIGAALVLALLYLSPFVLGWYWLLYPALAMTAIMLLVLIYLGSGKG